MKGVTASYFSNDNLVKYEVVIFTCTKGLRDLLLLFSMEITACEEILWDLQLLQLYSPARIPYTSRKTPANIYHWEKIIFQSFLKCLWKQTRHNIYN